MTKKLTTLQDLQKIDPTIQEVVNPYKEIPNINEDSDSRTVICVVFVYNNIYCKTMSEYELYNLCNTSMCGPCKFFVCDTNKAREIVKFIYYGHETHYRKIMVYALIFIWCCLVLFELLGGARFAGI